jgi:hypothetical protein
MEGKDLQLRHVPCKEDQIMMGRLSPQESAFREDYLLGGWRYVAVTIIYLARCIRPGGLDRPRA